mgnify:CR=1 FL=1
MIHVLLYLYFNFLVIFKRNRANKFVQLFSFFIWLNDYVVIFFFTNNGALRIPLHSAVCDIFINVLIYEICNMCASRTKHFQEPHKSQSYSSLHQGTKLKIIFKSTILLLNSQFFDNKLEKIVFGMVRLYKTSISKKKTIMAVH